MDEKVKARINAFEEGKQAFRDGVLQCMNPHKVLEWSSESMDKTLETGWDDGWEAEQDRVNPFNVPDLGPNRPFNPDQPFDPDRPAT